MATYHFELNSKPTQKGTYVVLLRITENKRHKRMRTPVELKSPKYWNAKAEEVRKSEPNYKTLNDTLQKMMNEAKEAEGKLEARGKRVTSQNVASAMKAGKQVFSFIGFAEGFAKRTLEAGDYRTYTKYITFLNKLVLCLNNVKPTEVAKMPHSGKKLEDFMGNLKKKELLFGEITLSFLNKFKAYLKKLPNVKHPELTLHQNTISKQFDIFKSLYHKGLVELRDEGLSVAENPFDNFVCETIDTSKEKLTWDEIEALKALDLEKGSFYGTPEIVSYWPSIALE